MAVFQGVFHDQRGLVERDCIIPFPVGRILDLVLVARVQLQRLPRMQRVVGHDPLLVCGLRHEFAIKGMAAIVPGPDKDS
jgi:hypothetical protein